MLLLSPNNSVAAQAHLIKVTSSVLLLYSSAHEETSTEVRDSLTATGYTLDVQPWQPASEDMSNKKISPYPRTALSPAEEANDALVIVHSSGSTGHPKPVSVINRTLVSTALRVAQTLGFQNTLATVPIQHSWGQASILAGLIGGSQPSMIPQHVMLSPRMLVRSMRLCPAQKLIIVPYTLKLLSESSEGLALLCSYDEVRYGGSPLPHSVGERLVEAGVKLVDSYGASEFGIILSSVRDFETDKGFNILRPLPGVAPYITWESYDDELYELVMKSDWWGLNKSNREDGAYATSDLFKKMGEVGWLYIGRKDDTLVHITGEKTNPSPMELTIKGSE